MADNVVGMLRTAEEAELRYLRAPALGIRLLRIPDAMVLEHLDEFVRKVINAMRTVRDNATK
jgi:hypothetical protein